MSLPSKALVEPEEVIQDMVDFSEPVQSCEEPVRSQSSKEQWVPTLKPEKPFVLRTQKAKKEKGFGQFVWEKKLPQSLVGRFIGRKGWHIKQLMEESGAVIELIPLKISTDQIILVDGTEKEIDTAAALITAWIKQFEQDPPFSTRRPKSPWRR